MPPSSVAFDAVLFAGTLDQLTPEDEALRRRPPRLIRTTISHEVLGLPRLYPLEAAALLIGMQPDDLKRALRRYGLPRIVDRRTGWYVTREALVEAARRRFRIVPGRHPEFLGALAAEPPIAGSLADR